jgi:hypothetical protein
MTEADLYQAIRSFIKEHKKMPTTLFGSYEALSTMGTFCMLIKKGDKHFYSTVVGDIELVLEPDIEDVKGWKLAQ